MQRDYLYLTEVADVLGVAPKVLSDLLYRGIIDRQRCPLLGRRRAIPVDYLPEVLAALRRARQTARRKRGQPCRMIPRPMA